MTTTQRPKVPFKFPTPVPLSIRETIESEMTTDEVLLNDLDNEDEVDSDKLNKQ